MKNASFRVVLQQLEQNCSNINSDNKIHKQRKQAKQIQKRLGTFRKILTKEIKKSEEKLRHEYRIYH